VTNAPPSEIRVEAEAPGEWEGLRDFALDGENRFTLLVGYGARDGEYTVRARPYVVNPYSGERLAGEWKELTFTLKRFTFDAEGSFGVAWEGSSASYLLKADPEAGTAIGYYTIDIDNNGSFDIGYLLHDDELGGALEWEAPLPQAMLPADNGQYTSRVRVYSTQDYGWDEFDVPLSIGNMPARINIAAEHGLLPGGTLSVALSTSDPGPDTVTSLTIDWGDGSSPATITGNTAALDHLYEEAGDYTITVTATDEDGTYTAEHLLAVYVPQTPESDWIDLIASNATLSEDGLSATLEVEALSRATGTNVAYAWDYLLEGAYVSGGASITLTRNSVYEPFRVALRVTDGAGHQAAWGIEFVAPGAPQKKPRFVDQRDIYEAKTPDFKDLPDKDDYEIHHRYQVGRSAGEEVLAKRMLQEKGIDVHNPDDLFAAHKSVHKPFIDRDQRAWWRAKMKEKGWKTFKEAFEKVDLDEYVAMANKHFDEFKDMLVPIGSKKEAFAKALTILKSREAQMALDMSARRQRIGIAVGAVGGFVALAKAFSALRDMRNHNPQQRAAFQSFLDCYEVCMEESEGPLGRIKHNSWLHLAAAAKAYAIALHADADTVGKLEAALNAYADLNLS
jgi:hypothetical protein